MKRICKVGIQCALFPGEIDSPTENYSSEAPDPLLFIGTFYPPEPHPCLGCNPPDVYKALDCIGIVFSAESQAAANLLARSSAAICKQPNSQQFTNDPQTATCQCPGGSKFSYTVPAGYMAIATDPDPEAWIAAANAAALAYAEQQVAILEQRSCAATTSLLPHPGWMCLGEELLDDATNIYTVTGLNAAGDWTFEIVGGSLPPGVSLEKTGHNTAQLTGSPTAPGVYTYTILAFRPALPYVTVSTSDTLRVFGITNPDLPDGTVGTAYNDHFASAGGIAPVAFSGTPPAGLTLHSDGTIDGMPTTATSAPFDVTITDADGGVCTQAVTITIAEGTCLLTTSSPLPDGTTGAAYSQQIASSPLVSSGWTITSGSLPDGLSLSSSGLISGTPTVANTFTFTAQANDGNYLCSKSFSITVSSAGSFCSINFPGTVENVSDLVWTAESGPFGGVSWSMAGGDGSISLDDTAGPYSGSGVTIGAYICVSDPAGYDVTVSANVSGTNYHSVSPPGSYCVLTYSLDGIVMGGSSFTDADAAFGPTPYSQTVHMSQGLHHFQISAGVSNDAAHSLGSMLVDSLQVRPLTHP